MRRVWPHLEVYWRQQAANLWMGAGRQGAARQPAGEDSCFKPCGFVPRCQDQCKKTFTTTTCSAAATELHVLVLPALYAILQSDGFDTDKTRDTRVLLVSAIPAAASAPLAADAGLGRPREVSTSRPSRAFGARAPPAPPCHCVALTDRLIVVLPAVTPTVHRDRQYARRHGRARLRTPVSRCRWHPTRRHLRPLPLSCIH